MLSRRSLIKYSALGLVSSAALRWSKLAAEETLGVIGYEQGDPDATLDPVVYDADIVAELISPISTKGFVTIDPIPDFLAKLVAVATEFDGKNRYDDPEVVATMLNLFGCPFKYSNGQYVAFCAAGIGYCAALAFARSAKLKTDNGTLRQILPTIDFFNYYPSPGVLNMSQVARGKSRWIAPHSNTTAAKGSLVIFDWHANSDPELQLPTPVDLMAGLGARGALRPECRG